MVGQASSPDIMMTSGDACPTNKGSLKVAAEGSLIYCIGFSFYSCGFRVHNQYGMVNSLWNTSPSSPPCEGGERGAVISSPAGVHL